MADAPNDSAVTFPADSTEKAEPALSTGALVSGGTLLINGLVLFGFSISAEQKLYLISVLTFLAPFVAGAIIRFKVWSPKTVAEMVEKYRAKIAEQERAVDVAKAQVTAARTAVDSVQKTLPVVVQSLLTQQPSAQSPVPAPETAPIASVPSRNGESLRPPSDRVYGLPEDAQPLEHTANGQPLSAWAPPERQYEPPQPPQVRPPRGYRRHALDDEA